MRATSGSVMRGSSGNMHSRIASEATIPRIWTTLTRRNIDVLASAAVLHDVGYAPRLAVTGFHPLDGARFLRDVHQADEQVVHLVANHSFALLEAQERGLRATLEAEFPPLSDQFLTHALVWSDMTTTPAGSGQLQPNGSRKSSAVMGRTARSGASSAGRHRRSSPRCRGWNRHWRVSREEGRYRRGSRRSVAACSGECRRHQGQPGSRNARHLLPH